MPALRTLGFLALGPLVADMLLFLLLFTLSLEAVRLGAPPRLLAFLGVSYNLVYAVSARVAGHWVTPARAGRLLLLTPLAMVLVGAAGLLSQAWCGLLAAAVGLGVAAGHYFTPFQVKMGHVRPFARLSHTVAFYNLGWGTGLALGPFLGGWLRGTAAAVVLGAAAFLASLAALLAWWQGRPAGDARNCGAPAGLVVAEPEGGRQARHRLSGWIGVAVGNALLAATLTTLWPSLGGSWHLSNRALALGSLALCGMLPLSQLLWVRLGRRLERPRVLLGTLLVLGAGYLLLPHLPWPWTLLPLGVTGWCAGGLFFHAIFYANADPLQPARSVGVGECVIGLGSTLGNLLLGLVAWNDAAAPRVYLTGCLLAWVGAATVAWIWRRKVDTSETLCQT